MNKNKYKINEDDLHAYVDHQLSADKIEAVEALMQEDPEIALQVQQWQQQNQLIAEHFTSKQESLEDIPKRFDLNKLSSLAEETQAADQAPKNPSWFYAMAASILMIVSGSVGWFAHGISQPIQQNDAAFVNSAISAHQVYAVEVLHPVEVGADKKEHLVAWLSKRVDHSLTIPKLDKYGYKLLGGRLLSIQDGKAAAQFMFEDEEGKRITLLVSKNPSYQDHALLSKTNSKLNSFYWMNSKVAYSVTGEANREKLRSLSLGIYEQINDKQAKQLASL